jgi:hypothetical protein
MSGLPVSKHRQDIERWQTACHEAAHAVARYLIRPHADGDEVTIIPTENTLGHHRAEPWFDSALRVDSSSGKVSYDREEIDRCIVQSLVGRYADRRAGCSIRLSRIGAMGDDERITECMTFAGSALANLRRRSARFVRRHWKAISAVARELLDRETLQADEVEGIVDLLGRPAETRRHLEILRSQYTQQSVAPVKALK